jgi:NADH-quinone oxidoreductase subunit A
MKLIFLYNNYFSILLFFLISLVLGFIIIFMSYRFSLYMPDSEKVSAYECGFAPFEDARTRFDVRFYIVAILFLIFDIEVAFIFP